MENNNQLITSSSLQILHDIIAFCMTIPWTTLSLLANFLDPRLYVDALVAAETKERIAANLVNFAYDPYNFAFLRQVHNLYLIG